eukprot:2662185-Lingulodinium_polyedra.AAC.1
MPPTGRPVRMRIRTSRAVLVEPSVAGRWPWVQVSTTPAHCAALARPAASTSSLGAPQCRLPGRSALAPSGPLKLRCKSPPART